MVERSYVASQMLKRIKVRNFLSLKDAELKLGPRNVLVGPNMSGKSNLLECLRFIRDAAVSGSHEAAGIQKAVLNRGGFEEIAWKGQPGAQVGFEIEVDLADEKGHGKELYFYEFSLRHGPNVSLVVDSERLRVTSDGTGLILIVSADGKSRVMHQGRYQEAAQNSLDLVLDRWGRPAESDCHHFWNYLQRWRFYHLAPALMRKGNPPRREEQLSEHGENLSAWLMTLQNYAEEFNSIKQVCRDELPGFSEILFQPKELSRLIANDPAHAGESNPGISVGVGEKLFRKPIAISRMSDGELAFLALVSLILAPDELSPSLLCIEEPENHLHPRLLEILVELINQRQLEAGAPQIILTTHSLALVDKLTIGDLIVTEKSDGSTRFTRPSNKKHLQKILSDGELSLGDLWFSGALDRP
jgi:predicted ATPase